MEGWRRHALKLLRNGRYRLEAALSFSIMAVLKRLPADAAIGSMRATAKTIGPLLPRHAVVMENLTKAYPEKSKAELGKIGREMWGHMGAMGAEYVFLDQLFDYDPESGNVGRIEVKGEEIFRQIHAEKKPCIFFTGHTGAFELLPVCAATFGLEVTALFRPPNNPYVAKRVLQARTTNMGQLVPSKAGAAWGLARALDDGGSVGVLVDQKFGNGILSTFFGRTVNTNPLLPKLARQYDCPVYPARCVRLDGGRYRLELEQAIELPRDEHGQIDIEQSVQVLNDTVERWVREYPEQWMWLHRRWQVHQPTKRNQQQRKVAATK
ncbi:MAG: lipid A biosynthesis lauroyl acyltransferase [Pseudomonadota bacterium]